MKLLTGMLFAGLFLLNVSIPSAANAAEHVRMITFFDDGTHSNLVYPDAVKGHNIEQHMLNLGADMMLFAQSAAIRNGDVWSVQNDTLREDNGVFKDFGVNCELSLNANPFKIAGLCAVFMSGSGHDKVKLLVKPTLIKDHSVWYKIFEDKEHGLAGYLVREDAPDFAK